MNEQRHFEEQVHAAAAATRKLTQRELVLARLMMSVGQWIPMPELVRFSGAYAVHSRVSDLRSAKHGAHQIDHRNYWRDGVCCSEYRLVVPELTTVHSD